MHIKMRKMKSLIALILVLILTVAVIPGELSYAAPARTIVYNLNGGTGTPPASTTHSTSPYRGTIANITDGIVTPPPGKQFAGWSPLQNGVANEWYAPAKQVIVSANGLELYAMWIDVKPVYSVTFRTKVADQTVPAQTVAHGQQVIEPASLVHAGYTFLGWYKDSSFRFAWNFGTDVVTTDLMLHAKWSKDDVVPWTVTYHMSPEVIGPGPNPEVGTTARNVNVANIPADTINPGKVFAGWSTTPARVLELKFRTPTADYVAVKYEGVHLYDVWVDANPTYTNKVTVDFDDEYQTMSGLGNSMAFNRGSAYLQIYKKFKEAGVPDSQNPALWAVNVAIGAESGAKLNVFRAIIGNGGVTAPDINPATGEKYEWGNRYYDGPNDTVWPEPGVENIVWNQPDWESKKDKWDINQIWYIKEAMKINPNLRVYGASWSPPYWMKTNLGVRNDTPDNPNGSPKTTYPLLDEAYFADYATYLCEYAWGMYAWYGIPISAVCPSNESEIDHGYCSHVIRGDDYERFLLDYLKPTIAKYIADGKFSSTPSGAGTGKNAKAPIMGVAAPEGTRIDRSTSAVDLGTPDMPGFGGMMAKPEIQNLVSVFTSHMYENDQFLYEPRTASDADPAYPAFMYAYPEIWMTEIGQQFSSYNAQGTADNYSMVNGLFWARRMSNQFASNPGFSSYILWNGTSPAGITSDTSRWINVLNAGSAYSSLPSPTGLYRIYKRFYTTAQFSRFINPGDIRIGADRVPFAGANVTAYKSADGKDFSIVALNENSEAKTITIKLDGSSVNKIVPYRTSNYENMRMLPAVTATGGEFTVTLPAMSMTTFVNDKGADNLPSMNYRDVFTAIQVENNDGKAGATAVGEGFELEKNGYLRFNNFNFADGTGQANSTIRQLRMSAYAKGSANGKLEVRIGNQYGKVVGVFNITSADAMTTYYSRIDTGDLGAYSFRDFCVVYKGEGKVYLERFNFDSTAVADASDLVTNGTFNTNNLNNWTGKGSTLTNVNNLYYRSRSLRSSASGVGVGAEGDLKALPVAGKAYVVNAYVIPAFKIAYNKTTAYESGYVDGGDATISLQFYNGTDLVASQVVATRKNINNIDWKQVQGRFIYNPPTATFTSVKLLVSISAEDTPFHIDEVTLTDPIVDGWAINNIVVDDDSAKVVIDPIVTGSAVSANILLGAYNAKGALIKIAVLPYRAGTTEYSFDGIAGLSGATTYKAMILNDGFVPMTDEFILN